MAVILAGGCAADVAAGDISKQALTAESVRDPAPAADSTTGPSSPSEPSQPNEPAEDAATSEPREQSDEPADSDAAAANNPSGDYTLRIPAVGMSVRVIPVQSTADRVLLPPADPGLGGWWSQGAAPGDPQGSAVIVGHSVRTGGGAFNAIGDLRTGDTISVDGSSTPLTYRVESIDVLSKDELTREAERIFDQSVSGRLVVITCEDWDGQTWQSNIVAIAVPA